MKLQAIAKLCKARKRVEIRNTPDGEQWVGDGYAFYRVDDGLRFADSNVAALFDFDETLMEKIKIETKCETDPRFSSEAVHLESDRSHHLITFGYHDATVKMIREGNDSNNASEMVLLDAAYIDPVGKKEAYKEYRVRPRYTPLGHPMRPLIAVHNGLFCAALIYPLDKLSTEVVLAGLAHASKMIPVAGLDQSVEPDEDYEADDEGDEVDEQLALADLDNGAEVYDVEG